MLSKLWLTKIAIFGIVLVIIGVGGFLFLSSDFDSSKPVSGILSPLATRLPQKSSAKKKEVIGFYPYWNLDRVNEVDLSSLSTVYYFAVDLNSDGSFNGQDPGLPRLNSSGARNLHEKVKNKGVRWGLTIVNLDPNSIARNVNNEARRERIIENTLKLMKDEGFTDLNIDLEYAGDRDAGLTRSFTMLVVDLTEAVHREIPGSKVSLDGFADSIIKPRIFDMKALGQIVDQVVIMAYDIHRLDSVRAGPIAPLFGKDKYEYDVNTAVTDYLSVVPAEKILLGVPFYGYEWPTVDNEKGAFVIRSVHGPEISSYRRTVETARTSNASVNFDDDSGSVWFSYFEEGSQTWRQVWFENERSLGLKLDLVNQVGLGGIAIFALGYDGKEAQPLWQVIKEKQKALR